MTDRSDPPTDPWAADPGATQRRPVPEPDAMPPSPQPATGTPPRDPLARTSPPDAPGPSASTGGWTTAAPGPTGGPWRRDRRDDGRVGSIVFGLILLGIGVWFFLEQTLGLDLPELRWDELWPLILIGIGLWIVLGAMRRER